MILFTTIYGLAGIIAAARQPDAWRPYYYSTTIAAIVLIALARLYLGLEWASSGIVTLVIAFIWLSLLGISHHRQRPEPLDSPRIPALAAAFVGLSLLLFMLGSSPLEWQ